MGLGIILAPIGYGGHVIRAYSKADMFRLRWLLRWWLKTLQNLGLLLSKKIQEWIVLFMDMETPWGVFDGVSQGNPTFYGA